MKRNNGRWLDPVLVITAVLFLLMGLSDLGKDPFGVALGLGTAIPLAAVYVWRKLREARGLSVGVGVLSVALFSLALFFLVLGITELACGGSDAAYGFVPGLLLTAAYAAHRRRELRAAEASPAKQREEPAYPPVRPASPAAEAVPAQIPVTVCPHCGAPGKGDVCEYCGMSKKA